MIDGDTLAVGDVVVRLHGIDAPERNQTCEGAGRTWPCGAWARDELVRMTGERPVVCEVFETDRYGRAVGVCRGHHDDLGEAMVAGGAAIAYRRYSQAYVAQEDAARQAGRGVWRAAGDGLLSPADWRAAARSSPSSPEVAPGGCGIKGNISDSGRIYHRAGQRDYDRTRIDTARGERWFCSEAEALAAGWRAATR